MDQVMLLLVHSEHGIEISPKTQAWGHPPAIQASLRILRMNNPKMNTSAAATAEKFFIRATQPQGKVN